MDFTRDWHSARQKLWASWMAERVGTPCQYLEIGVYEGRSLLWMLDSVLTHEQSTATAVDMWSDPDIERRFDRNLAESGHSPKVRKLKAQSRRALRRLPFASFDVVYVDGSHEGRDVLEDAVLAYPLVKRGGLMIFDDVENERYDVAAGLDPFLRLWPVEVIHRAWQVALKIK